MPEDKTISKKNESAIKSRSLDRDLSTWRKQMKAANKQGQKPEKSVWGNKLTEHEEKEWTWQKERLKKDRYN